jgi:hypothetical protein
MSSPGERRRERFWNQLLGVVGRGTVVPVVGEALLRVPDPEGGRGETLLYEALARRYAALHEIPLAEEPEGRLSATVRNHPEFRSNPHDVYQDIGAEYDEWNPPIPPALRALAAVRHFTLFVSTTFDDLLVRALDEERFGGARRTEVIAYSPKHVPSETRVAEQLASGRPVVFQLFGDCRNPLQFALTEGDKVEYMHALQSAGYAPERFLSELYDRPLLMLGNRFPDWLTRMFLRMLRNTALDHRDVPKQYLADSEIRESALLSFFLRNFATNTELVEDLTPEEFVVELAERWRDRFGESGEAAPEAPRIAARPQPMAPDAVFISYCATDAAGGPSRDAETAARLGDALARRGIDVWLDRERLEGGDEFERKIERYIDTCSLFVPLISETTEARRDGFFRKEWSWALRRLPEFTGSDRPFLVPVAIDAIDPATAQVPDAFRRIQFEALPGGAVDEALLDRLERLHRAVLGSSAGSSA